MRSERIRGRTAAIAPWIAAGALVVCSAAVLSAPVQEKHGEVTVMHGGVGEEDRQVMEQKAADYNLRLTFARKVSGAYLSDVRVVIRGARDAVLVDTMVSGPWLFARLPAGDITVAATVADQALTQKLTIQDKAKREWVFRFDPPAAE